MDFPESPLWKLSHDWLEKIDLGEKLVLVPQLLFAKSLSRDRQPYQDMALLIKVRNDLVHYKMQSKPPKYMRHFEQLGITLAAPYIKDRTVQPWPTQMSTSEGVRWAYNTVCRIVQALSNFVPPEAHREVIVKGLTNFSLLSDSVPRKWLEENSIDPNSDFP